MPEYQTWLQPISSDALALIPRLREWCALPTPSSDSAGIRRCVEMLRADFAPWVDSAEIVELPPWETVDAGGRLVPKPLGPALRCVRNPDAPLRIFLGIHTDVVYAEIPSSSVPMREEGGRLYGAGAADAKGGIAVMLLALQAFSKSPWAEKAGFEILLNPDEEIGSPGSLSLLREAAARNQLGLLFEPALPDGNLVSRRKGSGNFAAVLRGRGGHAGRDAASGRNALHGLAEFIVALNGFVAQMPGTTANVGRIEGGGPANRITDLGVARFNIRVDSADQMHDVREFLSEQSAAWGKRDGFSLEIHGDFASPPKAVEGATERLLAATLRCGEELGLALKSAPSGGVCDGNKLAAFGLPNVDTLGPVGGGLHGGDEWVLLDSLTERASLTALLLMQLASGEIAQIHRT